MTDLKPFPRLLNLAVDCKVSVRDITAQNRKTNALKEVSNRDELTGLLNRRGFIEKTNSNLIKTKKVTTRLGVMFIDLDGFKQVNDTFGHEKGDLVLQRVGEYLMECVSEKDIVARLGGDEFIIFIPDANEQDCIRLAEKIIEPQNPYVTPSIGIALSPKDGRSIETLIKHADMAMYEAKKTGKNKYHFFGSDSSNV
jgi:diguanylate cyclase (GGDEF)-like protein